MAFLRAMEAGLAGPDGHQAEVAKTDASWQCIQNGWEWVAISSQVEESIPELPNWFQMGMNSSNSIGKPQTELELAAALASLFQQGLDSQQAMKRAKEGDIKCQASLPDVCHYCQKYGGGPEFPLTHYLARFAKQYGAALQTGQEFMATLSHMNFRVPGKEFPLTRLAAWATMVTSSHKATDGLAKILTVADLQKLKSQSSMAMTEQAELILQDAWKTMGQLIQAAEGPNQKAQESHYQKAFGKLAVRTMLFLCQKQKHSKEGKSWASIPEILEQFTTDCQSPEANKVSAPAVPETEASEVQDLLTATPATMALLQNRHLKIGQLYLAIRFIFF